MAERMVTRSSLQDGDAEVTAAVVISTDREERERERRRVA